MIGSHVPFLSHRLEKGGLSLGGGISDFTVIDCFLDFLLLDTHNHDKGRSSPLRTVRPSRLLFFRPLPRLLAVPSPARPLIA